MMDREDYLWNQFVLLEDEIRKAGESNLQILGIVAAAATAILAAGVSQADPNAQFFTFLCVYIVTWSGYRLIEVGRRRTWRISTYIQVFIESELEYVKWETRLGQQRFLAEKTLSVDPVTKQMNDISLSCEKVNNSSPDQGQFFSSLASTNEAIIIISLNWIVWIATAGSFVFLGNHYLSTEIAVVLVTLAWNVYLTLRIKDKEKKLRRFEKVEREQLKSWKKLSLVELSKENAATTGGWINCQITKKARKIFQSLPDQEIETLFGELTFEYVQGKKFGEERDVDGIREWRYRFNHN
jgi:hypothetical protein